MKISNDMNKKIADLDEQEYQIVSKLVDQLFSTYPAKAYEAIGLLEVYSRRWPCLLYPHFNTLVDLLAHKDPIFRIESGRILSRLAAVDCQHKLEFVATQLAFILSQQELSPQFTAA